MINKQYLGFILICINVIGLTIYTYFTLSEETVLISKAKSHFKNGEMEEGFQNLKDLEQKFLKSPQTLERIALEYIKHQKTNDAISLYEKVIQAEPTLDRIKTLVALYKKENRLADALTMLSSKLIAVEHFSSLQEEKLNLHLETGDFKNAAQVVTQMLNEHAKTSLNIAPNETVKFKLKKKLADIYSWDKNLDDAITIYKELIKSPESDESTLKSLADLYIWNKDYLNASSIYKELSIKNPQDKGIKKQHIHSLVWAKKHLEAEVELKELPDSEIDQELRLLFADLNIQGNNFEVSERIFRSHLESNPESHEIRLKLAEILSWQEKHEESAIEYEKLLQIYPEDKQLKRNFAKVLTWQGDHKKSAKLLKETLD